MSRASTSPIPPQMYKHFAIVTIAFTALLALFAEGEKQEEVTERAIRHLDKQQAEARDGLRATLMAAPVDGNAMDKFEQIRGNGDFGQDVAFGQPTQASRMSEGKVSYSQAGYIPFSEEYLASLTEEEREALLKGLEESGMLDPEVRQEKLAALDRASAARSGNKPVVH